MAKQLQLGLDLKGGVHLVMRVHTDDALRIQTTTTAEQIRESLTHRRRALHARSPSTSPQTFRVEGIPPDRDAEFRRIADEQAAAELRSQPAAPAARTSSG